MTETPYTKKFLKTFNEFSYSRDWSSVFRDFTEITACTVHQQPYHLGVIEKDDDYEKIENLYLETVGKYNRKEIDLIVKLFSNLQMGLAEKPFDFLGTVYMQLEINNRNNGEFFTPGHIARFMAMASMGNIEDSINDKGYITVCEPTCGSGVMLIEAANAIKAMGTYDPRKVMLFQATDINRMCFNMCYIQLGILGIPGCVIHGNAITMEVWESRPTPQLRINQRYYPDVSKLYRPPPLPQKGQLAFAF